MFIIIYMHIVLNNSFLMFECIKKSRLLLYYVYYLHDAVHVLTNIQSPLFYYLYFFVLLLINFITCLFIYLFIYFNT